MEVCRICLSKEVSKDISELQNKKSSDTNSYSDIMLFCLGIQITEDSTVSTKLCVKCYKKILAYHTFKTLALKNDAYLRSVKSDIESKHAVLITDSLKPDKFAFDHIKQEHDYIEVLQDYESNDELYSVVEMIKYEFVPEESKDIEGQNNYIAEMKDIEGQNKYIAEMKDIKGQNNYIAEMKDIEGQNNYIAEEKDIGDQNNDIFSEINDFVEHNDIAEETNDMVAVKIIAENENATLKRGRGTEILQTDVKCEKKAKRKRHRLKEHCNICNKDVWYLKQHHLTMHDPASLPLDCHQCGRRFISESQLLQHMTSHTKDRPYECGVCEKKFRTKITMIKHKKRMHDNEKSHACPFCSKGFFTKYHLERHLRRHTGEKLSDSKSVKTDTKCEEREREICEQCGKSVWSLKEHSAVHRPPEQRTKLKCEACDKTFFTYASRHRHFSSKHLGIKEHCDICNKDYASLKTHHLLVHDPDSLPFACASCGRRFISAHVLAQHITVHTKDRPFECDVCLKKFRTKILIDQHKRQVHDKEKSNVCPFCSKSFFKKYHLQRHLRSHTNEKPYECAECGRMLSCRKSLTNHLMTHSTERMHQCTHCDKTFTNPAYVRAHMISHTKEKKHPCKYCGVKFGRSDHRNRHEFTAHEKHLATEELKKGKKKNS